MPKKTQPKRSALAAAAGTAGPAPVVQVGALCWRRTRRGELRVLLITSRDTGRWVVPKGWRMRRLTDPEAAAREAYEEAGVRGEVSDRSLGFFPYLKNFGQGRQALCLVRVFPIEVRQMVRNYPENGQRRIKWFALDKAARRLDESDLAAMVRGFDPEGHAAAGTGPAAEPTA